jgi:hypothetical protein
LFNILALLSFNIKNYFIFFLYRIKKLELVQKKTLENKSDKNNSKIIEKEKMQSGNVTNVYLVLKSFFRAFLICFSNRLKDQHF